MRKDAKTGLAAVSIILAVAATAAFSPKPAPGDADAIAFAIAVDSGEMMIADLALSKKASAAISAYAKDVREDHEHDLKDIMQTATKVNVVPARSGLIDTLQMNMKETFTKLSALDGKDFDTVFLDEMIMGHTKALDMINNRFLQSDLSSDVKDEITDMKKDVEEHLAKAKTLKNG